MYSTLCHVKADTAKLCSSLEPQVGLTAYYEIVFDVVLSLGLTELKAHICWVENVSSSCVIYILLHTNWHRHDVDKSLGHTKKVEPLDSEESFY